MKTWWILKMFKVTGKRLKRMQSYDPTADLFSTEKNCMEVVRAINRNTWETGIIATCSPYQPQPGIPGPQMPLSEEEDREKT